MSKPPWKLKADVPKAGDGAYFVVFETPQKVPREFATDYGSLSAGFFNELPTSRQRRYCRYINAASDEAAALKVRVECAEAGITEMQVVLIEISEGKNFRTILKEGA